MRSSETLIIDLWVHGKLIGLLFGKFGVFLEEWASGYLLLESELSQYLGSGAPLAAVLGDDSVLFELLDGRLHLDLVGVPEHRVRGNPICLKGRKRSAKFLLGSFRT